MNRNRKHRPELEHSDCEEWTGGIVGEKSDNPRQLPMSISQMREAFSPQPVDPQRCSVTTTTESGRLPGTSLRQAPPDPPHRAPGQPSPADVIQPGNLLWTGNEVSRFCYWPAGIPPEPLVAIVGSHLGRPIERLSDLFQGLRQACRQATTAGQRMVIATTTAIGPYVQRAAELLGGKTTELQFPPDSMSFDHWWQSLHDGEWDDLFDLKPTTCWGFVSPRYNTAPTLPDIEATPIADRMIVHMSREIVALWVRPRSNTYRLLRAKLLHRHRTGRVRLLISKQLTNDVVRDDLLSLGAVGWHLLPHASAKHVAAPASPPDVAVLDDDGGSDDDGDSFDDTNHGDRRSAVLTHESTRDRDGAGESKYRRESDGMIPELTALIHCTRRRRGPWPGQAREDFLDELIWGEESSDRSAFAAISRIVRDQRLIAAPGVARGGRSVVCFTAVPLVELHRLRVFRPHRGRWDFEPYGIAISKSWLAEKGARQVRYVRDEQWSNIEPSEAAFCQTHQSLTKSHNVIDWTVEQEWRVVGDVSLTDVASDQAFVFVATLEEATQLQKQSRWPVIAIRSE